MKPDDSIDKSRVHQNDAELSSPSPPNEGGEELNDSLLIRGFQSTYVSPYIRPADLREYHALSPEIARELLTHNLRVIDEEIAAQKAALKAERDDNRRLLEASIADRVEGRRLQRFGQQIAGFIVVPMGFLITAIMSYFQQAWPAVAFGSGTILAIVATFFAGRLLKDADSDEAKDNPTTDSQVTNRSTNSAPP